MQEIELLKAIPKPLNTRRENLKQQAAIAIANKKAGKKPRLLKKGLKFNPKYTRGQLERRQGKKLMSEISNIYKQHRESQKTEESPMPWPHVSSNS